MVYLAGGLLRYPADLSKSLFRRLTTLAFIKDPAISAAEQREKKERLNKKEARKLVNLLKDINANEEGLVDYLAWLIGRL